ncbi:MAG TPA: hypothetical protein VH353_02095 [Caulobacteraceae bacterium]|jgi:hypothetical protein|nr:hypothetical protein [Caulobacteraceae bacterium]
MTRPAAEVEVEVEARRSRLEETADALKDKITPSEVFEEASRAVGDAGQEVLARLLDQARRNPMAVALVGAGLLWLMKSSGQSLSRSTHELQDQASERISQAKEKVSDMKDQIGDTVAHAREAGRSAAGKVTSSAQNTAQLAQDSGRWLGQIIEDVVREEPLILAAVGVAVGFAIGSALPRTSVEDQTLGEAHDSLVEKGREAAHDTLEQAGSLAQAAYAAAREELRASGEDERSETQPSRPETV